jgi:hypothetical protein
MALSCLQLCRRLASGIPYQKPIVAFREYARGRRGAARASRRRGLARFDGMG